MNVHAKISAESPNAATISEGAGTRPKRVVRLTGGEAIVEDANGPPVVIAISETEGETSFRLPSGEPARIAEAFAAVAETLTALDRSETRLSLHGEDAAVLARLRAEGLAVEQSGALVALPELIWQRASSWLPADQPATFPETHMFSREGRRHPVRAPKPRGVVYARDIPWLGQELTFRALDVDRDLATFNRWMNDPRVDVVWEEAGDLETHRKSLEERAADPHLLTLIGEFDGKPFGYFELYWAKENRLGPHYDADDYDRGWHVLIGEDEFRGRAFITAWLPSLMHYMFLSDPRTRRIVGEPRWTHAQQIGNLDKAGFAKVKHVEFAHKRALLVMLSRERFFGDRLWAPEPAVAS
ncbi:GNAT family N-acetyltransferase [Methylopila sp. M107]|uniref:GNAT family N-acetyltransferase n=1 Tax=Methylopila sp. M107 TaxID=1101190 RepID=UPI0012DFCA98|nr:GNAT family N-acetyltransferase [Methylopila sp. M107]